MAGPKVQPYSLFYGSSSRRVGKLQKCTYEIDTNDGHEVVDEGTFFTDGVAQGKITADLIVPVGGIDISAVKDALNHADVKIVLGIIDGKIHKCDARISKLTFEADIQSGKHTGKIEMMTKTPQVTGL